MPTADEKKILSLLKKAPALGEAPHDALARLLPATRLATFRARQVIYLPGDKSVGVYFVVGGRVKVSKVTRDGKELTLAYRTAGEFFGEPCLLDGGPREEMAESMDNTTTLEIDRTALDRLLANQVGVSYRIVRALIARRRELETKVEQLIFKDVGSKLAELLLKLGAEHGIENERGIAVGIKITHQEMANLIGSTRETVSLTLSQFKRKGFILTEGRRVILVDRDGLKALV